MTASKGSKHLGILLRGPASMTGKIDSRHTLLLEALVNLGHTHIYTSVPLYIHM